MIVRQFISWIRTAPAGERAEATRALARAWLISDLTEDDRIVAEGALLMLLDDPSPLVRQAVVQAIHHAEHRSAFGKRLVEQPLMKNVLADLALECEAATALTLRVARAVDASGRDAGEAAFARLATAVGKYWICKRCPPLVNEAQECLGGAGYVEESMLPRLYRQAPLNSIWEGTSNMMCMDVLRAMQRMQTDLIDTLRTVRDTTDQLAQASAEAKAVRESLEDTRKRYEVELVPGTDLKEAQARDDLAQARMLSANRALENARDALDEITGNGRVPLPQIAPEAVFPPLEPAKVEDWVKATREQNPRVLQAKEQLVIAKADYRSRVSDAAPTLDLVGSISRSDDSEFDFGQRTDDSRVGVELNVPLYAGGAVSAAKRQAAAQERLAQAEYNRTALEAERQTRQLFNQVQTAYAETEAYNKAWISAQAAEKATRAGYDAGTRTITDVLDAQSRTVQARLNYDSTRYSLLLSLLQLKESVGALTPQNLAEIDRLESILSLYRADSALSKLNRTGRLDNPPFELLDCLSQAGAVHRASGGAFDVILVSAAGPEVPGALVAQLAPGGRLVMPVGERSGPQQLVRLCRTPDGLRQDDLGAVAFVPLIGAKGFAEDS